MKGLCVHYTMLYKAHKINERMFAYVKSSTG